MTVWTSKQKKIEMNHSSLHKGARTRKQRDVQLRPDTLQIEYKLGFLITGNATPCHLYGTVFGRRFALVVVLAVLVATSPDKVGVQKNDNMVGGFMFPRFR